MKGNRIVIEGGEKLSGTVEISGAKNVALPIMAASLLAKRGESVIEDAPPVKDVLIMGELLRKLGAYVEFDSSGKLRIISENVTRSDPPGELTTRFRGSCWLMGALLARVGKVSLSGVGGCAIGSRPIDLHLTGFKLLGAEVDTRGKNVLAGARELRGTRIRLDFPSVGATENIMLAASLARGTTVIENAAREPEIVDLANFMNKMGARIAGAGTNTIQIRGVDELVGAQHKIIPDRIEAGTYAMASAITQGDVILENVEVNHLSFIAKLREAGVIVEVVGAKKVRVIGKEGINAINVETSPFPGFPTDLQPPMSALLTLAKGASIIVETLFENRFDHVKEFEKMGADVRIEGRKAIIVGVEKLFGAYVTATNIRAGAALILVGLAAEGRTEIIGAHHIARGYVEMEEKMARIGARMERLK